MSPDHQTLNELRIDRTNAPKGASWSRLVMGIVVVTALVAALCGG
jgi:hypothetical protein